MSMLLSLAKMAGPKWKEGGNNLIKLVKQIYDWLPLVNSVKERGSLESLKTVRLSKAFIITARINKKLN